MDHLDFNVKFMPKVSGTKIEADLMASKYKVPESCEQPEELHSTPKQEPDQKTPFFNTASFRGDNPSPTDRNTKTVSLFVSSASLQFQRSAILLSTLLLFLAAWIKKEKLLRWAVDHGYYQAVQVLIAAGANVNAKDKDGKTALTIAVIKGHKKMVQLLKNAGAEE